MTPLKQRRARDPAETREAILKAARTLLAKDGPEGISLSEVAQLAGVNRGTAYQHFRTREKLIEATADWVSDKMFRMLFGDPETIGVRRVEQVDIADMMERLTTFAMDNPELGRIWLLQLLSSPDPAADPFWREFAGSLDRFVETDLASVGVDAEVLSIISLAGALLWPVWARSHAKSEQERRALADRYVQELLRLSMYGSLRSERFPQIAERLSRKTAKPVKLRPVGGMISTGPSVPSTRSADREAASSSKG